MTVYERRELSNGIRVLTAPMPHAQSTSCILMYAAGSRYEQKDSNGIAHFAEHMFFKGTERRPTSRDITTEIDSIGGEFNAFTGKEYTGYYVRCAAEQRPVALDVLVDMLRHSKFEPEEIEREKGVIVEEMNMYFDTPRDYIGGLYDQLLYGDQPLGWDIIGSKDTVRAATRETFTRLSRPLVQAGADGRRARRQGRGRRDRRARGAARRPRARRDGSARAGEARRVERRARACSCTRSRPTRRTSASASAATRSRIPTATRSSCSRPCSAAACRRASSPRCASGAGSRTTSSASTTRYTDAGSLYAQGGVDINRIDDAIETIVREIRRMADEPVPAAELEKARNSAKGRFVLQLENPHGTILFGLRREVLEGEAVEPADVLAGLDAVTGEDVQRVADDVIGGKALNLALIGPFDDAERFEKLLG